MKKVLSFLFAAMMLVMVSCTVNTTTTEETTPETTETVETQDTTVEEAIGIVEVPSDTPVNE